MRVRLRLGVTGAILIGVSLVTPAASAATGIARWVDDDAGAGGGPAACATAHYISIQDAINHSSPGDRVYVCPGTYPEQLLLDKRILVRARPLHGAVIQPPAAGGQINDLISITGDNARLRGFNIRIAADGTDQPCVHVEVVIFASGDGDRVRNNSIAVTGDKTLTGACGYDWGIWTVGTASKISFNHLTDFKAGGIMTGYSPTTIVRNTVRFLHLHEALCDFWGQQCFASGIYAWGPGYFARNAVYSGPNACLLRDISMCASGSTPAMAGMYVEGNANLTIDDNAIHRTVAGVWAMNTGGTFINNRLTNNGFGFFLWDASAEVAHNVVTHNYVGAQVAAQYSSDINLHDNDFRGNTTWDCSDVTSGSGTAGTANTWTNDLGNTEDRDGLCVGASVPGP